jgi:hypothetical protein
VKGVERYHSPDGVTEKPLDFTAEPPELLRLEGGTFIPVAGAPLGPGQYVFNNVPNAPYYLKRGTHYLVTDARTVDLGSHLLGRAELVPFTESRFDASLDINGLEPWPEWEQYTDLEVISELGSMGQLYPQAEWFQPGQTAMQGLVDYWSVTPMVRFEAARGDRAWLTQSMPYTAGTLPDGRSLEYSAVVRSLHLPPFSFDGSQPLPLSGTLQPLAEKQFPVDWRVSSFTAHAAQVHPSATIGFSYLYLSPAMYGLEHGWVGFSGDLLFFSLPTGHTADVQAQLVYGNPFPASWVPVGLVSSSFRTRHTLPGATGPLTISTTVTVSDTAANLSARPIQPHILPPRELQVDGVEAYSSRPLGLGGHVLSWQHPAAGPANAYRFTLYRYTVQEDGSTQRTTDARFILDGRFTSVVLPPDLLKPGSYYSFSLSAMFSPEYKVADQTTIWRLPYSSAGTTSGLVTTP